MNKKKTKMLRGRGILLCLLLVVATAGAFAQQRTITGRLTDQTGQPLPGVTVVVKGTTQGAVSNADGDYTLSNVSPNATLVYSFVGLKTQEVAVGNQNRINLSLQEESIGLDEIVAVGYGTMRKSDLTGSVESINMGDIPPSANINLTQTLRGYAAGLNVQGGSGAGDEPSISIRGQTTLSASTRPLIVLDGIIFQGAISDINVADVERVDVLKDASAAAIYGSRSANGVMLITTRKGATGKPAINFNTYHGVQNYTNHPVTMMNAEQYAMKLVDYNYMQYLYNWYRKKPTSPTDQGGKPVYPTITDDVILGVLKSEDERKNYLAGNEVDWVDEVTQLAPMSNYDLSISGAGDGFNYYVSGSYTDQKGVQVGDDFTRTTLAAKVEGDLIDWVTVGLNTSYSHRDHSGIEASMEGARQASPLASKYDAEGNYPIKFNEEFLMAHPLRGENIDNEELRKNLFYTAYARVDVPFIKGLAYDFNYSNNYARTTNKTFYPRTVYEGETALGRATIANSSSSNWIINNIVSYASEFADIHRVNVTLVYTREKTLGESSNINASRFPNEILGFNNVSFAEQVTVGSGAWKESSLGYMARLNYILNNRYLLTGTYRKDGFSGFGARKKYATFPSLSAAWTLSEEGFMEGSRNWLDHLKFRVSYGENGNQGIGRYSSLTRMTNMNYVFGSSSALGIIPNTMGNADLGWETTKSTNLGLDYSIFRNRISGEIDVYRASTFDVLVSRSLPGATGYTSVWTNIGEIANKGIELELRTVNIDREFKWDSRFVYAINRDEIVDLYGDGKDDIGNQWFIGEPISAIYNYERTGGVWTEEELYSGQIHDNFYPGQFRLADLNDDNKITSGDDRTIVGYSTPNYRFSIGNNLSLKNFTLSFLFNSIMGGNGYFIQNNITLLEATSAYDYANRMNMPSTRTPWTPDNGVDNAPAVYNYPSVGSGNYQDRSFIRLQDVSLVYKLPGSLLSERNIRGFQIYFSGKNLYTWTNWEGFDPEVGGSTELMMRSMTVGVRLSF